MTETKACPYLEIDAEVHCLATDWGKTEDKDTGQVVQHYGLISRNLILVCSSPEHVKCPTFRRMRKTEALEKEL